MPQLIAVWSALSPRRRLVVGLATLAMFLAVLTLTRMAARPEMALLYAGLESGRAGDVVQALEQRGAGYEIRGDSIYVDAALRDELRMTLAAEGLPANSGAGYELLDGLSGFGTTSQMFDAAYLRAKEGELARTILSGRQFRAARVHIALPGASPFRREGRATASVSVTSASGAVSAAQAKALRYLVASAVQGLLPADVSVIDAVAGAVIAGEDDAQAPGSDERAEALRRNVERLLEARVGYGNAVVELSVETVTERESIVEKRFDPEGRVAISTDTEERSTNAKDAKGSAVTVASNLPDGDAAAGGSSESQNSETRERVNFEVSEVQREVLKSPGAVRRISVAVLVDGVMRTDDTGNPIWEPRPEEELAALKELVASAVGFDEERGDVITLKSMEFEPVAGQGEPVGLPMLERLGLRLMSLVQLAVLAVVALVLGLFVLRPILSRRPVPALAGLPPPREPGALPNAATADQAPGATVLTGEIQDGRGAADALPAVNALAARSDQPALEDATPKDPVARLRRLIEERQHETVEILRSWMEDHEEKA